MRTQTNVNIHNRFDIEVRDAVSGELHQQATAYNIVLDNMWNRLCTGNSYFTSIQFGTGAGTPSVDRTTLFTYLGGKAAVDDTLIKAVPISSWKRKVVLNPEEYVGQVLTEVGVAYQTTTGGLVTHAMIQDAEGNPITITKTATDVITIYATIFITISTPNTSVKLVGLPDNNTLINYLVGGGAFPSGSFDLGQSAQETDEQALGLLSYPSLGTSPTITWTNDVPNKRRTSSIVRWGVTQGNGNVQEICFNGVFRGVLPIPDVVAPQSYAAVPIGTGDGSEKTFTLPSRNIDLTTLKVKLDGVETTAFSTSASEEFRFANAPANPRFARGRIFTLQIDGIPYFIPTGSSPCTMYSWQTGNLRQHSIIHNSYSGAMCTFFLEGTMYLAMNMPAYPYLAIYKWQDNHWVDAQFPITNNPLTRSFGRMDAQVEGNAVYLAMTDYTYDDKRFNWCKLQNGSITFLTSPNPPGYCNELRWTQFNGENYLALNTDQNDVIPVWLYKRIENQLIAQASLPIARGGGCELVEWLHVDGELYLLVFRRASDTSTNFNWLKLVNGTFVAQAVPTVVANPNYKPILFYRNESYYLLLNAWLSSESRYIFLTYKLVNGLWSSDAYDLAPPHPVDRTNPQIESWAVVVQGEQMHLLVTYSTTVAEWFWWWTTHRVDKITLTAPNNVAITADYTVNGIHKTDQYVVDAGFTIQFGEPT